MKRRVSWVLIGFIVVMVMAASGYEYQNLGVTGYIHGTTFPFHVLPSSITTGSVSSPGYPANTNISISTDTPLTAKLTIGNRTDQFPIGLNATRRYITLTNQIIQYTFSNPSNNRTAEGGMEVSSNG